MRREAPLIGQGVVRLIATRRRCSLKHYFWPWLLFSCVQIAATNYMLRLDVGHLAGFYIGGPLSLACLWFCYRLFGS